MKSVCRLLSQHMNKFFIPSKIYFLSVSAEILSKTEYRFLQAYIRDTRTYILTSFAQVLISFFERTSLLFVNYLLLWIIRICFRTNKTHHVTPKTKRLVTDVMLVGMLCEIVSVVLPVTYILFISAIRRIPLINEGFDSFSIHSYVMVYLERVGSNIAMEFVFLILALYLVTRYLNLPLLTLWRKTWKEKVCFTLLTTYFQVMYIRVEVTTHALQQIQDTRLGPLYSSYNCTEILRDIF